MNAVQLAVEGSTIQAGNPVVLFEPERVVGGDVTPDGQRAIAAVTPEERESLPITVLVNWTAGLN